MEMTPKAFALLTNGWLLLVVIATISACSSQQEPTKSATAATTDHLYSDTAKPPIVQKDVVLADTVFLEREFTKDCYHAVYIEKDRKNKCYDWLINFYGDDFGQKKYDNRRKTKEENAKKGLKEHNMFGLPQDWIPAYLYRGKYYIYASSDWGATAKIQIGPRFFSRFYMDGPYPQIIESVRKKDLCTFVITLAGALSPGKDPESMFIHILERKTMMMVLEFPKEETNDRYRLYLPADRAREFDMIVNYCETEKRDEYDFPAMNFDSLIKAGK